MSRIPWTSVGLACGHVISLSHSSGQVDTAKKKEFSFAAGILSQATNSKIGKAREEQGIEACDDLWTNDGRNMTLDPSLEFRVHLYL